MAWLPDSGTEGETGLLPTDGAQFTRASVDASASVRRLDLIRRIFRDRFAIAGLVVIVALVLLAVFANLIARYGPTDLFVGSRFEGISAQHWLGTDDLGRDNASRLVFGTREAFRVAFQVAGVTLLIAVPIGLVAGYFRRFYDSVLMRLMDALQSLPLLILALTFALLFRQEFNWALLGVSLGLTPTLARLVRAETLAIREEAFIEASLSLGTPTRTILCRRVLHNVASPIIVMSSIYMGAAILIEAGLSVLGVGMSPGSATWGSMLSDAFAHIHESSMDVIYPGAAITITVLAFNLLGDGLRDALSLDTGHRYGARSRMGLTQTLRRGNLEIRTDEARDLGELHFARDADPLLAIRGLTIEVTTTSGVFPIVQDVTFAVGRGEVVGLVGESGSGKTVTSLSILRLLPSPPFSIAEGEIEFAGVDLLELSFHQIRNMRNREIAMVFQDPMAALNPGITVGRQIAEAIRLHEDVGQRVAQRRAVEMLGRVGIPDPQRRAMRHPHELSGGMRQRVMVAMALACSPKLLVADEPTTALDVTVQAQILELLGDLRDEFGLSILLVTHDLGVVANICDRVVVMYAGQIVEQESVNALFSSPAHPYSAALLGAVPRLTGDNDGLEGISGRVPVAGQMPSGCRFHPRCEFVVDGCRRSEVPITEMHGGLVRCIRAGELSLGGRIRGESA